MNKTAYFWTDFEPLLRIIVVGIVTYIGLILLLRISGKRTLASMNAFDFIITVTIGSAFGRILTAKEVSIAEALTTFALLISLQHLVAYISIHSPKFSKLITSQPVLLYYKDEFIWKNLKKERIKQEEVLSAIRSKKFSTLKNVEAVILESNGSFSIIEKSAKDDRSSYENVLERNSQ
jgi:uncharacterized membrane protein YcaP (DUF421 family)